MDVHVEAQAHSSVELAHLPEPLLKWALAGLSLEALVFEGAPFDLSVEFVLMIVVVRQSGVDLRQ